MKLTDRDVEVVNYLERMKVASTDTIHELFFNGVALQSCQRRLKQLYDNGYVRRCREHFTYQYSYYILKPKQFRHNILLTDFNRELNKIADIVDFKKEFSIGSVRSDGLVAYTKDGDNYIAFVEAHIRNTRPDIEKYIELYKSNKWKKIFPTFPQLIVISDKRVKTCDLFSVIHIREDLSNICEKMKDFR